MAKQGRSLTQRLRRYGLVLTLIGFAAVGIWGYVEYTRPPRPSLAGLTFVSARRTDVNSALCAPGKTASENSTIIECKLERLPSFNQGQVSYSTGASTILSVVDEGSYVKKGDVLCTLDASEYEELVRQQEIKVDRAKADLQKAKLDFETSQLGVSQFRDGLLEETMQELKGQLKMAEADRVRAKDRLAWSEKMKGKGYVSADVIAADLQEVKRQELEIVKAKWDLDNFVKFGAPMELKLLSVKAESARGDLVYYQMRYERYLERFEFYKKMVDFCTIRAPHDGFVIYANTTSLFSLVGKIEPGVSVRQGQTLFQLPDLGKMKVITTLAESVLMKVKPGMMVHVKIPALLNRELTGRVVQIGTLPDTENTWITDMRSFNATVHLDDAPLGIKPEMSAEVTIDLSSHPDVIAIPREALAVEDGSDYCYVAASEGHLERRHVTLGESNIDLLEVVDGLDEGEQIVFDVSHIVDYAPLVVDSKGVDPKHYQADAKAPHSNVAASHSGDHASPHKSGL